MSACNQLKILRNFSFANSLSFSSKTNFRRTSSSLDSPKFHLITVFWWKLRVKFPRKFDFLFRDWVFPRAVKNRFAWAPSHQVMDPQKAHISPMFNLNVLWFLRFLHAPATNHCLFFQSYLLVVSLLSLQSLMTPKRAWVGLIKHNPAS